MSEAEKLVRIIDCETTGMDPEVDRIVELGSVDWTPDGLGNPRSMLVHPGIPIPATASAVHHITDDMVSAAPDINTALDLFDGPSIFAAHNAKFDRGFIPLGKHWICTYKVAMHLWPDAPGHTNQTLRYWLKLESPPAEAGELPHRALYDAWTTARLLERALGSLTAAEMVELSSRPVMLPSFNFGKHAGEPLPDVPRDYLRWVADSGKVDNEDAVYTAKRYLGWEG